MTVWKRMLVFVVLACLVMAWIPVSASAVDPVSAATMANALAQAVTAYGASQGVSMTFDVANTDGIGEGVKELWDNFKEDVSDNDVPTYDSLAVTVWSTLFSKVGDKLAINLDAESVSYLDKFWNWLLSGPAEMQKVDNQYYEWSLNQDNTVDPINIFSSQSLNINGYSVPYLSSIKQRNISGNSWTEYTFTKDAYWLYLSNSTKSTFVGYCINPTVPFSISVFTKWSDGSTRNQTWSATSSNCTYNNGYYFYGVITGYGDITNTANFSIQSNVPIFITSSTSNSPDDILSSIFPADSSTSIDQDNISVQPYVGDAVPQDVYIPDNDDVNYVPIPAQIPLDVNWDDELFGDGSEALSDAQSEAATNALDNAIADNPAKTLELADTADPPAPAPGEVYIPFLPVTLPSFNFNFSGIWHYVVDWIGSLGAWFSMVLTVWSNLPYAMTVPVYACLVILIVLGVYRRFLS